MMSHLTLCNYCNLKRIRVRAKRHGQKVTVIDGPFASWATGKDVYVHPPEVKIAELPKDKRKVYFASWFAQLTNECCC